MKKNKGIRIKNSLSVDITFFCVTNDTLNEENNFQSYRSSETTTAIATFIVIKINAHRV